MISPAGSRRDAPAARPPTLRFAVSAARRLVPLGLVLASAAPAQPAREIPLPPPPEAESTAADDEPPPGYWTDLPASELDLALEKARQRRANAPSPRAESEEDFEIARLLFRRGELQPAATAAREGARRTAALGAADLRASFLSVVAVSHARLGDRTTAVETATAATALVPALPAGKRRVDCHLDLGLALEICGVRDQAQRHYREAQQMAEALALWLPAASATLNLGNLAAGPDRRALARAAYERALDLFGKLGLTSDHAFVGLVKLNQGTLLVGEGQPEAAIPLFREAVRIQRLTGQKYQLAESLRRLANALRLTGRATPALREMRAGFAVAREVKSADLFTRYHLEFVRLYEQRGELRNAVTAMRNAYLTRETMVNEATRARVEELRERSEAARREREMAELRERQAAQVAEIARARAERTTLWVALGAGVALTGVTLGWFGFAWRARARLLRTSEAARLAAEDADRLKTRFLGAAAHDIKSPLANVTHLVDRLRAQAAGDAAVCRQLDLIQGQVRRVLGHTRDFLDGAALEQGRLALFPEPMDLADVARTVIAEQRWHAEEKGQTLDLDPVAAGAGAIHGDHDRLHQVVANLVNNAIKFSPRGTRTRLSLERTPTAVRLAVADEGPGLSAEALARLYTPFTRLGTRSEAGESSHGLGLSIAQEIARLHGGRIAAHSTAGRGATFVLELPVAV